MRFALPNDIYDRLYGYQRDGVAWMAQLLNRQHGGWGFVLCVQVGRGQFDSMTAGCFVTCASAYEPSSCEEDEAIGRERLEGWKELASD